MSAGLVMVVAVPTAIVVGLVIYFIRVARHNAQCQEEETPEQATTRKRQEEEDSRDRERFRREMRALREAR